jgi:hypothetical protein
MVVGHETDSANRNRWFTPSLRQRPRRRGTCFWGVAASVSRAIVTRSGLVDLSVRRWSLATKQIQQLGIVGSHPVFGSALLVVAIFVAVLVDVVLVVIALVFVVVVVVVVVVVIVVVVPVVVSLSTSSSLSSSPSSLPSSSTTMLAEPT